jgi:hypothetical protein
MRDHFRNLRLAWALALVLILVGGAFTAHRLAQPGGGSTNPCRALVTNRDELCGVLNVRLPPPDSRAGLP